MRCRLSVSQILPVNQDGGGRDGVLGEDGRDGRGFFRIQQAQVHFLFAVGLDAAVYAARQESLGTDNVTVFYQHDARCS